MEPPPSTDWNHTPPKPPVRKNILKNLIASVRGPYASGGAPTKKIAVVVNPASGQDRPFLKTFNKIFLDAGYDWELYVTKESGDGQRLARQAVADGAEIVAAFGGDGTVMEVACGLRGTNVPLAILPGGTGNVLAIDLGIPRDLASACDLIVNPERKLRTVDMGQIGGNCFILRVGVGLEASVIEIADRDMKDRYGIFAYIVSALQAFREPAVARYHLVINGEEFESEGLGCIIANSGSLGVPGLSISPSVDLSDGLLDVFVIRKADLAAILSLASGIVGGVEKNEHLLHWKARMVSVISNPVQSVQGDGELFGSTPISVKVLPKAVNIIVPPHNLPQKPADEDTYMVP